MGELVFFASYILNKDTCELIAGHGESSKHVCIKVEICHTAGSKHYRKVFMCKCTPNIRTLFCGKPGCEWPPQSVVVGPTPGFPADEVCRWPSKIEKLPPPVDNKKLCHVIGFPIISKLIRGHTVELEDVCFIPDDQLLNESKNEYGCIGRTD